MTAYFNNVYGQNKVVDILRNMISSGRVPHALLFSGSDGVGKEATALSFALELNKSVIELSSFAEESVKNLHEPYIKYIIPLPRGKNETDDTGPIDKLTNDELEMLQEELDKKKSNHYYKIRLIKANNIKISSIRDINRFLSLDFSDIKYRIVLLSNAHLMREEAQNALLKNLEEPPEGVIFILCTPFPSMLRETIRSRCWLVSFSNLTDHSVKEILTAKFGVDETLARTVAPFSGGSVTRALDLIDNDINALIDRTIQILRNSFGGRINSAYSEFKQVISENDADLMRLYLQMMLIWINDVIRFKFGEKDVFFVSHKDTLEKFNNRFPSIQLNEIVSVIEHYHSLVKNNVSLNVLVLNLIFQLHDITIQNKQA